MSRFTPWLHRILQRTGFDVKRHTPLNDPNLRRRLIMNAHGVDFVLDVGAACGQYGRRLRSDGYRARIHSLEPRAGAFATLRATTARDARWTCQRLGLAAEAGTFPMFICDNGVSSSLLRQTELMRDSLPMARVIGTETVELAPLDAVWDALSANGDIGRVVMLKLDVQGAECSVLRGARGCLPSIALIEIELPLVALYEGAPTFEEALERLADQEYQLVSLEPNTFDERSARVLEVNAMLSRPHRVHGRRQHGSSPTRQG